MVMGVLELSLAYSGYIRCLPLDQQLQVAIDNSDLSQHLIGALHVIRDKQKHR